VTQPVEPLSHGLIQVGRSEAAFLAALNRAREALNRANIPTDGRWVVISELTWLRLRHPGLFNRKPKSKAVRRARGREIRKGHLEK